MGELSSADVLAMTRSNENGGFLEGNGIIILLLFLLFLGGGLGGLGNNASVQGTLTRADVQDGFNNQNVINSLNNLAMGMNNGFAGVNMNMNNGFNNQTLALTNGFNGVQTSLANLGFQMQQCCCDLKSELKNQTIQDLRDKLFTKDNELQSAIFSASQSLQTRTLEDFILANK